MPQSELVKIQDGPRHFDQRNSPFSLGAVRESRKLPWLSFAVSFVMLLQQKSVGAPEPEAPRQSSHPHPQLRTLITLLLPPGVGSTDCSKDGREEKIARPQQPATHGSRQSPPHSCPFPLANPVRARDQWASTLPLAAAQVSTLGIWGSPAWSEEAKWRLSQTLMFPGLGPYFCFL